MKILYEATSYGVFHDEYGSQRAFIEACAASDNDNKANIAQLCAVLASWNFKCDDAFILIYWAPVLNMLDDALFMCMDELVHLSATAAPASSGSTDIQQQEQQQELERDGLINTLCTILDWTAQFLERCSSKNEYASSDVRNSTVQCSTMLLLLLLL
jgi:hypothetical protein